MSNSPEPNQRRSTLYGVIQNLGFHLVVIDSSGAKYDGGENYSCPRLKKQPIPARIGCSALTDLYGATGLAAIQADKRLYIIHVSYSFTSVTMSHLSNFTKLNGKVSVILRLWYKFIRVYQYFFKIR